MKWTPEMVQKLKEFVDAGRLYTVNVRGQYNPVVKVTPVQSVPNPEQYDVVGWFSIGNPEYAEEIEDNNTLDHYSPEDFFIIPKVALVEWWNKTP